MSKSFTFLSLATALALVSAGARAQGEMVGSVPGEGGVTNAFEIGLGLGYTQGFGDIGQNQPTLGDLGSEGAAIDLGLGYRINPNLLVGAYGTVAKFALGGRAPANSDVWSGAAGVQGNWHFIPAARFDPWLGLGFGWRGYFVSHSGTDTMHGLDLARLQVGVDYQVTRTFAVAPVLGASLSMLLTQRQAQQSSFADVGSPKVNVFVFGGLVGRFDLFGKTATPVRIASL